MFLLKYYLDNKKPAYQIAYGRYEKNVLSGQQHLVGFISNIKKIEYFLSVKNIIFSNNYIFENIPQYPRYIYLLKIPKSSDNNLDFSYTLAVPEYTSDLYGENIMIGWLVIDHDSEVIPEKRVVLDDVQKIYYACLDDIEDWNINRANNVVKYY